MVAVDKGEVESSPLGDEARQRGLLLLGVVLDHVGDSRPRQCL
jgi:hypothetical protein